MRIEKRCREIPLYEKGDMMLREDSRIGKKLLKEIDIKNTAIIIDKPADGYLEEVKKEVQQIYSNIEICVINEIDEKETEEFRKDQLVICVYSHYLKTRIIQKEKAHLIFVNIRKTADKKEIVLEGKEYAYSFYFVSNVYKIENIEDLEKVGINRIHTLKKGFGLARSPLAYAKTHEIVFAGAPHLKRNAFIIALERNVTVPCIIATENKEEIKEAEEAVNTLSALAGKSTRNIKEYLEGKKWIYITTHTELLKTIRKSIFIPIKEITKCGIAYSGTDKTMYLIAMHQIAQHIFTMITTKDRGKSKKIVEILPKYGIILEEHAEVLRSTYKMKKEEKECSTAEKQTAA